MTFIIHNVRKRNVSVKTKVKNIKQERKREKIGCEMEVYIYG